MTSPILPLKILLIENDPAAAEEIRSALAVVGADSFDVEWVRQLSEGLHLLKKKNIAAVLLELSLPDSQGIETFDKLFTAAPDIPILKCSMPICLVSNFKRLRRWEYTLQWMTSAPAIPASAISSSFPSTS